MSEHILANIMSENDRCMGLAHGRHFRLTWIIIGVGSTYCIWSVGGRRRVNDVKVDVLFISRRQLVTFQLDFIILWDANGVKVYGMQWVSLSFWPAG